MPATMSKKKPKPKQDGEADRHKGKPLMLRVTAELKEALRDYARSERRSTSQAGALLLEEILTEKGFYPPKETP